MRLFVALASAFALSAQFGCRPQVPPQFTPSAEFGALLEGAESDEDQELWGGLQQKVLDALADKCGTPNKIKLLGDDDADPEHLKRGAAIYTRYCVQCHGVSGDGAGEVAQYLNPLPRDYRRGIFKFTSTPYGAKPRRSDIIRTLKRGVPGTAMPEFSRLSNEDLDAVTDYVLALARRGELELELIAFAEEEEALDEDLIDEAVETVVSKWKTAESQLVMPKTVMPMMTEATIESGRELFVSTKLGCVKCHGDDGRGGFFGTLEVSTDAWGNKTFAADLTSGMLHGGGRPIDIYRRIHSGINGSPMPGFASTFADNPDDIWHLVHFVKDIGERRRRGEAPVKFVNPADAGEPEDSGDKDEDDADNDDADAGNDNRASVDVGDEDVGDEDVGDEDVGDEDVGDEDEGDE